MTPILALAKPSEIDYPTSDGRPMAETDDHRLQMNDLIGTLGDRFADDPMVYVSGNLLVYYVPGDRLRHLSPDVFVVKDVAKHRRPYYLIWEERKGPDVVIELTSKTTKEEDIDDKYQLYQDVLKVPEYFLFDPHQDYLEPPLQGYRRNAGLYVPIEPVQGRLPSEELNLHLEMHDGELRLYDPATGQRLPTQKEAMSASETGRHEAEAGRRKAEREHRKSDAARIQAEAAKAQSETARQQAEAAKVEADAARQQAEAEANRLRKELEKLRSERRPGQT